jgi:predicted unusual protein kinase regulating ubiquinone biosynthesis (AarF/ABC1/UbiB family)
MSPDFPRNVVLLCGSDAAHDPSVPVLLDFGLTKRLEPAMKVAFARLMHSSEEMDVDGLLKSFDEMGLKLNRYDPFEDMRAMRSSFSDTVPKSEAKEARKKRNTEYKQRQEARQEEEQVQKGGKLRNPVDAWPAELVFFTRVTAMLRGLCSSLEVRHPYMSTMAGYSRVTLREEVPASEHAVGVVYPRGDGLSHALQARLEAIAEALVTRGDTVGMQV